MRGRRNQQLTMLAFIDLEERVPTAHPLRTIKRLADEALTDLSSTFDQTYAKDGYPSIPPERLPKAPPLIARGERSAAAVPPRALPAAQRRAPGRAASPSRP